MAIIINDLTLKSEVNSLNSKLIAEKSNGSKVFEQDNLGRVLYPSNSSSSPVTSMFNVGMNNGGWTDLGGAVTMNYTGGPGYLNVNGCYNPSTSKFTAPFTGIYLFKQHVYIYGPDGTYGWYCHPHFSVNDSLTTRRPNSGNYRMRLYGLYANNGFDTDCSEIIYLIAGDNVGVNIPRNGTVQGYGPHSAWSGVYLGS
jgi:hypothetical protein